MKKEEKKDKKSFKERWSDKRERAKIELTLYGIFFLVIIIFIKASSFNIKVDNNTINNSDFINNIGDNYEYDMIINVGNDSYHYFGKRLGNNGIINIKDKDTSSSYSLINLKYYEEIDGNFILTSIDKVYPYIDYNYIDINNIKEYIKLGKKENDTYKVKVSDIILNSDSDKEITIKIDNKEKSLFIDYSGLFDEMTTVNIKYSNIDKIMSLNE